MIKIVLFIFIIINAVYGNDQICKKIYLDQYIQMKNIPLNIKLFENKKIFKVPLESMFFKKNYGMSKLEYKKIVDLHYYLNGKDRDGYCSDLKTQEDYQDFKLFETLHLYLIDLTIKTQNFEIAKKLFNEYDLIDGALSEGKIYEITLPLLIHMQNARLLFTQNKKNINKISKIILEWIEANNNPYYNQADPNTKRDVPLIYDEYRKSIKIYYTLGLIQEGEISPNRSITYLDFLQTLKSHDLTALADEIDNGLKCMYKNSI